MGALDLSLSAPGMTTRTAVPGRVGRAVQVRSQDHKGGISLRGEQKVLRTESQGPGTG